MTKAGVTGSDVGSTPACKRARSTRGFVTSLTRISGTPADNASGNGMASVLAGLRRKSNGVSGYRANPGAMEGRVTVTVTGYEQHRLIAAQKPLPLGDVVSVK
jgi:hypothetical protein